VTSSQDITGHWTHTFRQSDVGTFRHCPEQLRLKWSVPYTDMPGRTTLLGTAVHAVIERALLEDSTEAQARSAVRDGLEALLDGTEHRPDLKRPEALDMASDIVGRWFAEVLPLLDLTGEVFVEHRFTRTVYQDDQRTIRIQGTIDLVDGSTVWDWKTGNMVYRPEAVRTGRETVQHVFYCAAMSAAELPDLTHTFRYAFMPRRGGVSIVEAAPGPAEFRWLMRELRGMADLIEARPRTWPLRPTDWWCSDKYCPVWRDCRGQFDNGGNSNG